MKYLPISSKRYCKCFVKWWLRLGKLKYWDITLSLLINRTIKKSTFVFIKGSILNIEFGCIVEKCFEKTDRPISFLFRFSRMVLFTLKSNLAFVDHSMSDIPNGKVKLEKHKRTWYWATLYRHLLFSVNFFVFIFFICTEVISSQENAQKVFS